MSATSATFRREALNSATETDGKVSRSSISNTEHLFADPNRAAERARYGVKS